MIGAPGAGKSTLVNALLERCERWQVRHPFAREELRVDGVFVGHHIGAAHPEYPGTDRLSMSAQRLVVDWLARERPVGLIIAEGDRLATAKFFEACTLYAPPFTLMHLATPVDVAATRRADRGSSQTQAWVTGRETKVRRLVVGRWDTVALDGRRGVAALVDDALAAIPALAALRS